MSTDGEFDPTLPEPGPPADSAELRLPSRGTITGYHLKSVIGRGGMGEVVLARDPRMERDVAVKRMLATRPSADAEERFLREAKVQARLDHPAIVPVYELGRDSEGQPFFVMKKIGGTTLATLLERGAPIARLLRAMIDVCLAIDLAHTREIVHRDLKPANIILGDYGEVYVLDWGVARLLDEQSSLMGRAAPSQNSGTQAGQILGTPGYMAPEQLLGGDVTTAADIYSIGAIVFEILAGESLHPRGGGAIGSTLAEIATSPAERAPTREVAFELDRACRDALVTDPTARPTARQLADRIQAYLDGDRDVAQRREMAQADLAWAREALAAGDRARTMKLAGRAVTLDPKLTEAVELATSLMLEPPDELPPDLVRRLAEEEVRQTRARSRRAVAPLLAFFALIPIIPLMNIRNWSTFAVVTALMLCQAAIGAYQWKVRLIPLWLFLTFQLLMIAGFSRLAGPFLLTPMLCSAAVLSSAAIPWLNERPAALALWSAAALLIPIGAEAIGVFDSSWELQASPPGILDHGTVFLQSGPTDSAIVIIANVAMVVLIAAFARAIARDRRVAERRLYVQAWHLEQLLPKSRTTP